MLLDSKITNFVFSITGFAISMLIPVWLGTGGISGQQLVSIFLISLFSHLLGYQFHHFLRIQKGGFAIPFQIIVGFTTLSFLVLVCIQFLNISPIHAFGAAAFLVIISCIISYKIIIFKKHSCYETNIKNTAVDVAAIIIISLLTTLWCREIISSLVTVHQTGIFSAWPDIFLHSSEITSLQNYSVLSNQSFYLAGTEQSFYHVASYSLSSFYASITNEPALNVSTYFWTPVGIILMGIAAYGLGAMLLDRCVGFAATAAIFLLPDASMYGAKISFFGFHWLLQISPGSGYALAIVLVALAMYVQGVRQDRFALILWSMPIVLLSALFRVQIAAPAAVMFTFLAAAVWRPAKLWHRNAAYLIFASALILTVLLFESIELAPHFLTGNYIGSKFFDAIHARVIELGSIGKMYKYIIDISPLLLNWLIGYAVFLSAALGLIFPVVFIFTIKKLSSLKEWKINIIPFFVILSSFMMIVLLPVPADGDFSNFGHRQFVLIYIVSMVLLVYWVVLASKDFISKYQLTSNVKIAIISFLLLVGVSVPWINGQGIQQPNNWALGITSNLIPEALFNATSYIRQNSQIQDWVLSSNLDPLAKVVSLTERSAFLSRESLHQRLGGEYAQIYKLRKVEFEHINNFKKFADLKSFGLKNNVKWFLKYPNEMQGWTSSILHCAIFESGGYSVFNLQENSLCND
jgi:hypothetical protein